MRLGLDIRCLGTAQRFRGVGTVARELAGGLLRDPGGPDIVLLRFAGQEVDFPGVPHTELGPPPRGFKDAGWLLDKARVPAAAWSQRLDLLHVTAPMELWYGYHIWKGMPPVVITAYDIIPALFPEWSFPVHGWFTKRLYFHYLHLMKKAARLLSISRTTADDLVQRFGFDARRIDVVPLGVQAHFRPPDSLPELQADLRRLGVDRPYLLHVGGDSPHKDIESVVHAVEGLWDRGVRVPLVLAGRYQTPALQPHLDALRSRHGDEALRVLGYVAEPDLVRLYQGAEVFVFPSLYEGFGLPPLEAMACGTPAVVSDAPALVEFAGPGARIVGRTDVPGLVKELQDVLTHPNLRRELSEAGQAWASGFTWERTLEGTRAGYEAATR